MDEKQTQEKAKIAGSSIKISFGRAFNAPGKAIAKQYRWNKEHTGIVPVGEIDLQARIDAQAKGMTASEQICRILRGDTSSLPTDQPLPPGDYCLAEEMTKEQILASNLAPLNATMQKAQDSNMTLEEVEGRLQEMLEEVKAAKAAAEAPKENTEVKENA